MYWTPSNALEDAERTPLCRMLIDRAIPSDDSESEQGIASPGVVEI